MAEGQTYVPRKPLSDFVAFLWHQEARRPSWRRERLLPTGTVELVLRLSDPCLGPVVCGPHSLPFELQNAGRSSVIAAHFRPGGFFPFAAIPPAALHNLVVPLEELWGSAANELQERLCEARGLRERFGILEAALMAQAVRGFDRRREVRFALRKLEGASVGAVAEEAGLSRRQLGSLFKDEVGLAPKAYSKVRRFQSVIRTLQYEVEVDWGMIALDAGYFDQAHFGNDFREFAGMTPSAYLSIRTSHLNHLPIDG